MGSASCAPSLRRRGSSWLTERSRSHCSVSSFGAPRAPTAIQEINMFVHPKSALAVVRDYQAQLERRAQAANRRKPRNAPRHPPRRP